MYVYVSTSSPGSSPLSVSEKIQLHVNSWLCDLQLLSHEPVALFDTMKIFNIFGDTWPDCTLPVISYQRMFPTQFVTNLKFIVFFHTECFQNKEHWYILVIFCVKRFENQSCTFMFCLLASLLNGNTQENNLGMKHPWVQND